MTIFYYAITTTTDTNRFLQHIINKVKHGHIHDRRNYPMRVYEI